MADSVSESGVKAPEGTLASIPLFTKQKPAPGSKGEFIPDHIPDAKSEPQAGWEQKPPDAQEPTPAPETAEPTPQGEDKTPALPDVPTEFFPDEQPPAPAAEPTPAPEDLPSDPSAAKDAFAKLRIENRELQRQLAEASTKIPDPQNQELVQSLQEQLAQANEKIGRIDLAQHPEFQRRFDQKIEESKDQVKAMLKEFDVEEGTVEQLFAMRNYRDRIDLLNRVAPDVSASVVPMLAGIDAINANRNAALENHRQELQQLSNAEQQHLTQSRQALLQQTVTELAGAGHPVFRKVAGNDQWNGMVDRLAATASQLLATNDVHAQAKAMTLGAAAGTYLQMYRRERAERTRIEGELAKIRGARAPVGAEGSARPADSGAGPKVDQDGKLKPMDPMGLTEALRQRRQANATHA